MREETLEILMATYNGEKYLREQLDSILAQDDSRWHLTVSDDGSTDGTASILDSYVRMHPDKITRVFSGRRFGGAKAHFLWLLKQCDADYIAFSDQDDVLYPDKVRAMLSALLQEEKKTTPAVPVLVYSDLEVVDGSLHTIHPSYTAMQGNNPEQISLPAICFHNTVTGCACCFNRALAEMVSCVENADSVTMHDHWLAMAAAAFGKIVYLNRPTIRYRQHGGNSVGAKNVKTLSYWVGRLSGVRETVTGKKKQAAAFAAMYRDILSPEDARFLEQFSLPRSGFMFYYSHRRFLPGLYRKMGFCLFG